MPGKLGTQMTDGKPEAAVDHGPVCVTARRVWNCRWYHVTCGSVEGRGGAVLSGQGSMLAGLQVCRVG